MSATFPTAPGYHDLTLTLASDDDARYTVKLPAGDLAAAPLVLVLHYGGEPTGFYGRPLLEMLVAAAWPELPAIYLAPVAQGGDWRVSRNRDFALRLLEETARACGTADARRLLVGYSMGAIGVWHFLAEAPASFAAAIAIAGPAPENYVGRVPVHAINSDADRLFPVTATSAAIAALAAQGAPCELSVVSGIDHFNVPGFTPALAALLPWLRTQLRIA